MGFSDIGCYGGEIDDAEPRPPRRQRPALLAVLQHGALQPVARVDADRPASAPDRRRHPDLRLGAGRLRRQPQSSLRHDPAGAEAQRLPHVHERQVARRVEPDQADRHLAAAARLRRVLRHDHRRRQLLRSEHADARQRERRARGEASPAFFYTDAISDQAVAYIDKHRREHAGTPFFEYVAYTAPHWPLHAHDEDIAKYKGRFDEGWDRLREARLDKLVEWGILHGGWKLSPRDPDAAAVGGRRAQGVAPALHGGVRRAGRSHGPGHRPHPAGARAPRHPRRHGGHLPRRQRRMRRGHPGGRHHRRARGQAHDRALAHAQRRAGALRQRSRPHAGPGEHLPELRHRVGEPLQHAVPPLQALDPRRRHLHPAHRALAERHRATRAECGTRRATCPTSWRRSST